MTKNYKFTPELEDALRKANMKEEDIAKLKKSTDGEKLTLDDLDGVAGGFYDNIDFTSPANQKTASQILEWARLFKSVGLSFDDTLESIIIMEPTLKHCKDSVKVFLMMVWDAI